MCSVWALDLRYGSPGGLDLPFGSQGGAVAPIWHSLDPMWPYSAARVDFWTIADLILRFILNPKSMKCGVDFR